MNGLDLLIFNGIKNFLTPFIFIQGLPVGAFLIVGECVIAFMKIMDIKMAKKVGK